LTPRLGYSCPTLAIVDVARQYLIAGERQRSW
jgi:hypothetical protein